MIGTYRIYSDGKLLSESKNLLTTQGQELILGYLAGSAASYAGAIAVGNSNVAPTTTDTKLGFEFGRGEISLRTPDYLYSQIIFKASLDLILTGWIYELGLYPTLNASMREFNNKLVSGFSPDLETLSGGTSVATNARIGNTSYQSTAVASGTSTVSVSNINIDFSGYLASDSITLGFFVNDANASSITLRFRVDASNYYQAVIVPAVTNNYYAVDVPFSSFAAVGAPTWSSIKSVDLVLAAGPGGSSTVQYDGLRVNDNNFYSDYGLVSRSTLGLPIFKDLNQQMDIEYALGFNA